MNCIIFIPNAFMHSIFTFCCLDPGIFSFYVLIWQICDYLHSTDLYTLVNNYILLPFKKIIIFYSFLKGEAGKFSGGFDINVFQKVHMTGTPFICVHIYELCLI